MFICEEHGRTFMQRCCEHVSDAIDADHPAATSIVLDGADTGVLLCSACLPSVRGEFGRGSATEWTHARIVIVCGDHAEIWYARTGDGDLLAAIEQARARASQAKTSR